MVFEMANSSSKFEDQFFEDFKKELKKCEGFDTKSHIFVLFGASGDLAKKSLYPNLFWLFRDNLIPEKFAILGYARSDLNINEHLRNEKNISKMKFRGREDELLYEQFLEKNFFLRGSYDNSNDFERLNKRIEDLSKDLYGEAECNRIFYLAVPPNVYGSTSELLSKYCKTKNENYYNHLVVEKPFGLDLQTSNELSQKLAKLFREDEIYRIDHFLGKEMVQSLLVIRFANVIFREIWNNQFIESVLIDLKETSGVEGRGGHFDQCGIIRDVMQNHLLQILTLLSIEEPKSNDADDIRDEKVKLLKQIADIELENVVLGQYIRNENEPGYVEDVTVPEHSITPTYAALILKIKNKRWQGVPFILRAGKALDENKTEVRIQFKQTETSNLFEKMCERNELVLRLKPKEGVYLKICTKRPGFNFIQEETNLDLTIREKYKNLYLPEAYERLLLEIFVGNQMSFVRNDELAESWRIFTPVLHEIERQKIKPIEYKFGSSSLIKADLMCEKVGKFSFGSKLCAASEWSEEKEEKARS